MDARKYLSRAFELNRSLEYKERRLSDERASVPYSGPLYGDVKIDSNMKSSAVEHSAIHIVFLEDQIKALKKELEEAMRDISSTIRRVGNTNMEAILEMRYLSFLEWDDIITHMGYSRCYVFKLHSQALRRVKMLI